jgi:hypothetical protein
VTKQKPYQPLLFRVLHGLNGLFVLAALFTGFWVYNTYDGRFGKLPLPQIVEVEGVHGTVGLYFFITLPAFALYSFHAGRYRLMQSISSSAPQNSTAQRQVQQHWVNTLMLLAATWSAFSGRLMKEEWIINGTLLQQPIYYLHLLGWLILLICFLLHLWTVFRAGGIRLVQSIAGMKFREQDHPKHWPNRVKTWWSQPGTGVGAWWRSLLAQPALLRTIECIVLGGILLGFILPAFLPAE